MQFNRIHAFEWTPIKNFGHLEKEVRLISIPFINIHPEQENVKNVFFFERHYISTCMCYQNHPKRATCSRWMTSK